MQPDTLTISTEGISYQSRRNYKLWLWREIDSAYIQRGAFVLCVFLRIKPIAPAKFARSGSLGFLWDLPKPIGSNYALVKTINSIHAEQAK